MEEVVSVIGFVATVISCAIAIYQTSRKRALIRQQKADVWNQISRLKGILRGIEKSPLSGGGMIKENISRDELETLLLTQKHNLVDYEAITVAEENLLT